MHISRLLLALAILSFNGLFSSTQAQQFPQSWQGIWSGTVHIWSPNHQVDSFPMSLEITPTDSLWNFIVRYQRNPSQPDIRGYSLVILDDSLGHFAIDEHNDILLDAYRFDDCLMVGFGGMGSELLMRICKEGESLQYEITSGFSEPTRVSGDTILGTDTIPEIRSYELYNMMKARLDLQP
ncbi:hypothetical protein [Pontibacter sp. G13]|uniref:hypothetical protein n=1 Tax=Pontibacter sp. G13 TaxID=3074898 RepID=UPI00288B94A6|nr:hypothetical protein [Pontibacter sp. G13]WNJ19369.1 hypothetical protein RJD25_02655 [Pontibacter sp. G13]